MKYVACQNGGQDVCTHSYCYDVRLREVESERDLALASAEAAGSMLLEVQAESVRLRKMLNELGFCPEDGDSMPCTTCGAGL